MIAARDRDRRPRAAQHAVEMNWHNAAARLAQVIAEHGERGIWHLWISSSSPTGRLPGAEETIALRGSRGKGRG